MFPALALGGVPSYDARTGEGGFGEGGYTRGGGPVGEATCVLTAGPVAAKPCRGLVPADDVVVSGAEASVPDGAATHVVAYVDRPYRELAVAYTFRPAGPGGIWPTGQAE